jgi:hypothetical protein
MGTPFLSNDLIQAAIVAYIKTKADIVCELASANEIRENQYQGTEFKYPALRVRMISNTPLADSGCGQNVSFSLMVFSEEASSLQSEQIAGIIATEFHGMQFSSNSIAFAVTVTNSIPAVRIDAKTWRSEVLMTAIVSG